jgi:hypothetical protein
MGFNFPAVLRLGGSSVGPLQFDVTPPQLPGVDLIAGADALSVVPLVLDASAAETRIQLEFMPPISGPGPDPAPLSHWSTGLCRGDHPDNGPEGPDLFLVEANLDGAPLTLVLDTGADITFIRQSAIPDLASRPTLSGLPVHTAFAGNFFATITRAHFLSVGGQSSAASPLLFGPSFDEGLDEGPIIAQVPVPVEPGDDVESVHERIKIAERAMLTTWVGRLAREGVGQ